ncbi:MAG: TonB family protein [Mucilaginibacter sp.]|nr:TonB family protein [Mucilaginibacter sp.]
MRTLLLILIPTVFSIISYAQKTDTAKYSFDSDKIYTTPVEVMPEYCGGTDRLYFRLEHIRYIFSDRMKNIQGKVLVSLVIEKDGSVSNIKIVQGLTEEQDKEVIRVVKNLRKWKPGIQAGKPVRVQLFIPIDFKLIKT